MGDPRRLTSVPTRVDKTDKQPHADAPEVIAWEKAELCLRVYEIGGTGPGYSATVKVETSMQNVSSDDALWHAIGTFTAVTLPNTTECLTIASGMLRYVRWVITLAAGTDTCTFEITGVGRPG